MGRFLLASDDARTRIGIGGALERAGHQVDRVTHLQLAARSADLSQVTAVVVGLEHPCRRESFIQALRSRRPEMPVVALLDARSAWQTDRLQSLGATVVFGRPLPVADLIGHLEDLASDPPVTRRVDKGPLMPLSPRKAASMSARA
jgi:DNA-binding response OmpR family regulator